MNASASALLREDEVQSKICKVRTFGRSARFACAALFGFGLVGSVVVLSFVALGPKLTTVQLKVWTLLVTGVLSGVALSAMYQLYRLFGNLAAGAIYTSENVRSFVATGLILLVSWIMDVGLYEKDHADALQRDADLVI